MTSSSSAVRGHMRARGELALKLMNLGRYGEAIPHLTELLRLDPGANQGNGSPSPEASTFSGRSYKQAR